MFRQTPLLHQFQSNIIFRQTPLLHQFHNEHQKITMNKKIKKYILVVIGIFLLGASSLLIHSFIQKKFGIYVHPQALPPPLPFHPTGTMENPSLLYPGDPTNDQILIGASHNVFVGKILAQTGNKETEIGPRTQYKVQVIDNIKGELKGVVTVDMLGGYDKDGKLVIVEEEDLLQDSPLLQPGFTYLFASRYNQQENWYTIIAHPNARKVVSKDSSLSIQALQSYSETDEKVKKFESIYPFEILDKADVANLNTRNNFKSLSADMKAAAQVRASEAKALPHEK